MDKSALHVFLAVGEHCELESQAIRATLEYFGIRVTTQWIGRPNDLVQILSGQENLKEIDYLLLNFHGDHGCFCLPELSNEIYEENEPKGKYLSAEQISYFANLKDINVIASGCTLGENKLANTILDSGVRTYIAPKGYINGDSNLMFLTRFFYEIKKGKSEIQAFEIAQSIDEETLLYTFYN